MCADIRYIFLAITVFLTVITPASLWAETRVAIVDTAHDTRPYLDGMADRGVMVIGRYYSRCLQPELIHKRLIDHGGRDDPKSEIRMIADRGMAILSIYQYYSSYPSKFSGENSGGLALPDQTCNWEKATARSVEEEALLDATAAVAQARLAGQPENTAIYFAIDFELLKTDTETQINLVKYFRVVNQILGEANYKVGAYGSGLTLEILQNYKDKSGRTGLIDFAWIMASRSFYGSSRFHRSMEWNLFQNQVDREWFGAEKADGRCSHGLPIDTNVQNPLKGNDIGFWSPASGPFSVPKRRNEDIFNARRFACNGDARVRQSANSPATELTDRLMCSRKRQIPVGTQIPFVNSVRVQQSDPDKPLVQVDINDDGTWDGWTWRGNLTSDFSRKPDYIFGNGARASARCQ